MQETHISGSTFLHPENILAKAGLTAGRVVADLGCGGGYFALAASRIVGDTGRVYAVDILKDALSSVAGKAKLYGLSNITTVWSDAEQVGAARVIADRSVDYVLLVQILSQVKHMDNIFKEALRICKPQATVVVVDWRANNFHFGPPTEKRLKPELIITEASQHQLAFHREIEAGPYHFGLVFERV
ncbi:MAG: class I SAM-dependent methyltransferase [Patescibacteria group bacterium]